NPRTVPFGGRFTWPNTAPRPAKYGHEKNVSAWAPADSHAAPRSTVAPTAMVVNVSASTLRVTPPRANPRTSCAEAEPLAATAADTSAAITYLIIDLPLLAKGAKRRR